MKDLKNLVNKIYEKKESEFKKGLDNEQKAKDDVVSFKKEALKFFQTHLTPAFEEAIKELGESKEQYVGRILDPAEKTKFLGIDKDYSTAMGFNHDAKKLFIYIVLDENEKKLVLKGLYDGKAIHGDSKFTIEGYDKDVLEGDLMGIFEGLSQYRGEIG